MKYVGGSFNSLELVDKVTGRARYGEDLNFPHSLEAGVLRSPHPHALIKAIDVSKAKALPGVKALLTGRDLKLKKFGQAIKDQLPLARERVRYIGDEVAAVAAVDTDTLQEALELIKVDYRPMAAVFDPVRAIEVDAPQLYREYSHNIATSHLIERGDLDIQADYYFEEKFRVNHLHQGYLEPISCTAQVDASGRITLHTALQSLHIPRNLLASALGLSPDRIRIISPVMGGGFGGKVYGNPKVYLLSALLARECRLPVHLSLSRQEEFIAGRPQAGAQYWIRLGVNRDGSLVSKEMQVAADNGAYSAQMPWVFKTLLERNDSLYRIPNLRTGALLVYTNKVPTGQYRGYGSQLTNFVQESMLNLAAQRLGLDPLEIRLKNCIKEGEVSVHGCRIVSSALDKCLQEAAEKIGLGKKRPSGQGVGISCALHLNGNRSGHPPFDGSSALVKMDEEGRVTLVIGEQDYGQGFQEAVLQIVAEVLTIPPSEISIISRDSDQTPFSIGTLGSRETTIGGNAARLAALDLKETLLSLAAGFLDADRDRLSLREGAVVAPSGESITLRQLAAEGVEAKRGLPLMGEGIYNPPGTRLPDEKGYGNISPTYSFAAHAAEVEVDEETGELEVKRILAVHDSGRILNPLKAEGQLEGGVVQGLGYALMEAYRFQEGRVLNPDFSGYQIPTSMDVPPIEYSFIEEEDPVGPFGGKSLGEIVHVPTASALAAAVFDATGVMVKELPITSELIWRGFRDEAKEGSGEE